MQVIEINFNYRGALIEAKVYPDENYLDLLCPVELNGNYAFTLCLNESYEWSVMRESDGLIPEIDSEILNHILKKLKWQLQHAA